MPESLGCARTVPPRTYRSYCWVTHFLEARLGLAAMVLISSSTFSGLGRLSGVFACSSSWSSGRWIGRW